MSLQMCIDMMLIKDWKLAPLEWFPSSSDNHCIYSKPDDPENHQAVFQKMDDIFTKYVESKLKEPYCSSGVVFVYAKKNAPESKPVVIYATGCLDGNADVKLDNVDFKLPEGKLKKQTDELIKLLPPENAGEWVYKRTPLAIVTRETKSVEGFVPLTSFMGKVCRRRLVNELSKHNIQYRDLANDNTIQFLLKNWTLSALVTSQGKCFDIYNRSLPEHAPNKVVRVKYEDIKQWLDYASEPTSSWGDIVNIDYNRTRSLEAKYGYSRRLHEEFEPPTSQLGIERRTELQSELSNHNIRSIAPPPQ